MQKSTLGWVIAGGVAAVGGVGLWLYERAKPAPAAAIPATTPASTSTNSSISSTTTTEPATTTAPDVPAPATPPATPPPATDTNTLPAALTATAPAAPTVTLRPLGAGGALNQGSLYLFAGLVPDGITTATDMQAALVLAGWNPTVTVIWFGPTAAADHTGGIVDLPALANYLGSQWAIAFGQWGGATGTVMPSGTTFWAPVVITPPSA
jgi:pyruvate/2-oxoglutarate dehydrogenase complex dihydrolipoamide acyltransferase (E2) component